MKNQNLISCVSSCEKCPPFFVEREMPILFPMHCETCPRPPLLYHPPTWPVHSFSVPTDILYIWSTPRVQVFMIMSDCLLQKHLFIFLFVYVQDRLGRCAQQCQDNIQDNVDPNTTQSELTKYQAQLDSCVDQCCKTHLELVPKMFERMRKVLSQVQEPSPRQCAMILRMEELLN